MSSLIKTPVIVIPVKIPTSIDIYGGSSMAFGPHLPPIEYIPLENDKLVVKSDSHMCRGPLQTKTINCSGKIGLIIKCKSCGMIFENHNQNSTIESYSLGLWKDRTKLNNSLNCWIISTATGPNHDIVNSTHIPYETGIQLNMQCFDTGRRRDNTKEPILLGLIRDDNIYEIGFEAARQLLNKVFSITKHASDDMTELRGY